MGRTSGGSVFIRIFRSVYPVGGSDFRRKVVPNLAGANIVVDKTLESELEDGKKHGWRERWFVTLSDAHSARQTTAFEDRFAKAARKLDSMIPKKDEGACESLDRAQSVLKEKGLQNFVRVEVDEMVEEKKKYKCKGRPGRNTPYDIVETRKLSLAVTRDSEATDLYLLLAGWRIFVTNTPAERTSLNQSSQYYRDEYTVERGFHRFKRGSIPAIARFPQHRRKDKGPYDASYNCPSGRDLDGICRPTGIGPERRVDILLGPGKSQDEKRPAYRRASTVPIRQYSFADSDRRQEDDWNDRRRIDTVAKTHPVFVGAAEICLRPKFQ